ncbi:MAG TPA: M23 family metallopeptidase [Flavobacteriales bacterium]|nr:M23 family metallopeptidase [Flavobacteriales bacterium]
MEIPLYLCACYNYLEFFMILKSQKSKKSSQKLIHKYILEIRDEDTFEKKFSYRLSRLNVITVVGLISLVLTAMVIILIAYTPLREYIPGYTDVNLSRNLLRATYLADSLAQESKDRGLYIQNLKSILQNRADSQGIYMANSGNDELNNSKLVQEQFVLDKYKNIKPLRSKEDSLLREQIEAEDRYNLSFEHEGETNSGQVRISKMLFFAPLKGIITDSFNLFERHYGIDVVAAVNEAVKATLDGTVIIATWTSETGYIIGLQHKNNILSVYKHNSVLLKKVGNKVKAGEVIAIIGDSGELTTGPHLHFELWFSGTPINPKDYMIF